jgi:hypothetical protein
VVLPRILIFWYESRRQQTTSKFMFPWHAPPDPTHRRPYPGSPSGRHSPERPTSDGSPTSVPYKLRHPQSPFPPDSVLSVCLELKLHPRSDPYSSLISQLRKQWSIMAGQSQLTQEIDVWSFSMCCIEILTLGRIPWGPHSDDSFRHFVLSL